MPERMRGKRAGRYLERQREAKRRTIVKIHYDTFY
jgi:hypothetical protein